MNRINFRERMKRGAAVAVAGVAVSLALHGQGREDVRAVFEKPPESARPWVYWYFMDGNLSREGMTADLEAMKAAGIGGVIFLEVGIGIPRGPVAFMSPEWLELFGHAVREADRLGIELAVGTGPGWCGSGGPWVAPEHAMQHTVASETAARGPARFDAVLPRPKPRAPFFGERTLTPGMKAQWADFYRDEAVLAFPTPEGQARLKDADEKALYFRAPYSSAPGVKPFLLPETNAVPPAECVAPGRVVDLTGRLDAAGRLAWDVPPGDWTILRVGRTLTGQTTRPAPEPGLGFESGKFEPDSIDAHLAAFTDKLLATGGKRRPGRGLTTLHFDSWEMSSQNGSAAFLAEFRRRRGYDPLRYLPAFTGRLVGGVETTERFLWDVRQTAQELVIANHVSRIRDYAHRNGLLYSTEPYDMNPCCDIALGAVADVPMCEFWSNGYGFRSEYSCFEAVSVAHTMGRPVVGAEAFTAGRGENWKQHPASMKAQGDWALCCGINRFVFHRYQHQPRLDQWPGMTMGPYGVYWERTQTWWGMVGAYHAYLARCQALLRLGLPVADILYLLPEGAPQVFRPPADATEGELPDRRGYSFDGCAPDTLLGRVAAAAGRAVLPDGMSYRALVLPETGTMTPALLRKVAQLAEAGVPVLGAPPARSPSLSGYPACDREVADVSARLAGLLRGGVRHAPSPAANPLAGAKWIWCPEGNPAASAPPGERRFTRAVALDTAGRIVSARISLTADNSFEVKVNGRAAGRGDNFHKVGSFDVTALVRPGDNRVEVAATNGGDGPNPAGLIAALDVRYADGRAVRVVSDRSWAGAPADGGEPQPALELGDFGTAPWHLTAARQPPELYPPYADAAGVLAGMGVPPDFESDGSVRYIHRVCGETDVYFIANREQEARDVVCRFRVAGKRPEWWDPVTGTCRALPEFETRGDVTSVPLRLEALGSGFVVFQGKVADRFSGAARNRQTLREVARVGGAWAVTFDAKWGGPEAAVAFASLQDWTQREEPGIRHYSGVAVYRAGFDAPPRARPAPPSDVFLSLGDVKNMAAVTLNGQDLGTVWCAPWRVRVPAGLLRERGNALEVRVANLWVNRLIGDAGLPKEKHFTQVTGNPYRADAPLQPSGLLGPVSLLVEE
jgi:hypothetical protein